MVNYKRLKLHTSTQQKNKHICSGNCWKLAHIHFHAKQCCYILALIHRYSPVCTKAYSVLSNRKHAVPLFSLLQPLRYLKTFAHIATENYWHKSFFLYLYKNLKKKKVKQSKHKLIHILSKARSPALVEPTIMTLPRTAPPCPCAAQLGWSNEDTQELTL